MSDERKMAYVKKLNKLDKILMDTYHPLEDSVLGENLSLMNLTHVNISKIDLFAKTH